MSLKNTKLVGGARKLQNSIKSKVVQSILGTEKKQQQILLWLKCICQQALRYKNFTLIFKNFKFPFYGRNIS